MEAESAKWSDREIGTPEADRLNFRTYSEALRRVVLEADTPLTIGVFGPWGSGKSSLMRLVQQSLEEVGAPAQNEVWSVWFNAWRYDREEALWRALILQVLGVLRDKLLGKDDAKKAPDELPQDKQDLGHHLEDLETSLYREVEREEIGGVTIDWEKMVKGGVGSLTRLSLSMIPGVGGALAKMAEKAQEKLSGDDLDTLFTAVQRERRNVHRDHIRSVEKFQGEFQKLVEEHVEKEGRRLVAFVDDLDRCLPEKAIEVLEAIKLFLDVPGCVFLIAADRKVIERGIQVRYKSFLAGLRGEESAEELARRLPITGDDYLEKIVQLPFHLPPLREGLVKKFIEEHEPQLPEGCAAIFSQGVEPNPRKVKRTLNIFRLLLLLAEQRAKEKEMEPVQPPLLAKMVIIQSRWRELFTDLQDYPNLLQELEKTWLEGGPPMPALGTPGPRESASEELNEVPKPPAVPVELLLVNKYWRIRALGRMLTVGPPWFGDLSLDQLREYIYLARSTTEAAQVEVDIDERRRADLMSNDPTRIRAAVAELDEAEKEVYAKDLPGVMRSARPPVERASAGSALALLGDPRPGIDPEVTSLEEMEFCYVPPGPFWMGSDDDDSMAYEDEKPLDEVNVAHGYWMARYSVTVAQFRAFVKATAYELGDEDSLRGLANHPVVWVSWREALDFCDWLTAGWRDLLPEGYVVTLPSEAEWEKAARGGQERPEQPIIRTIEEALAPGRSLVSIPNPGPKGLYPWGNEPDHNRANYDDTGIGTTSGVGCFPAGASPYGCLDMAGNVWEWCSTLYADYPYDPDECEDLDADGPRVVRGGAFYGAPRSVRCAVRSRYAPGYRVVIGFRVVVSPGSPE
ncbi:MAG: hypothetical protein CEE40_06780 [Chloroflexi bacterium B3_Chlor]|nr:MAG: hypothetical protein CEE40_06780 [Chloroflexi bacterium B3_Chlor]